MSARSDKEIVKLCREAAEDASLNDGAFRMVVLNLTADPSSRVITQVARGWGKKRVMKYLSDKERRKNENG